MADISRKIIHIDMDAFYASVEQRDFPEYRGKPLIVGGSPDSRGVVAACSYEARRFGIHSAMPSSRAWRLCPQAIFVKPRFDVYQAVSREIQAIFYEFTDKVEPLSLDEAYLDVSECNRWSGSATLIAREIKSRIQLKTGMTASAGVSYNKFLAKIASDMDKPDGLYVIKPEEGETFIEKLPIGRFFGVGRATEAKMKQLNIHTGLDLKNWSRDDLVAHFGKPGGYYYEIARGIDRRTVNSHRTRKSVSKETTFSEDLDDPDVMHAQLSSLAGQVSDMLRKKRIGAYTLTIKVKYADFTQVTRSITFEQPLVSLEDAAEQLRELLAKTDAGPRKVRLLGVGVSNLVFGEAVAEDNQMELFEEREPRMDAN